jgi:predicted transcriptional regulator
LKLRRTRYEVVWEILEYCSKPRRITQLIQGCNLNPNSAKKYIHLLIAKELLMKEGEYYKTTEKGIKFAKLIEEIYEGIFLK